MISKLALYNTAMSLKCGIVGLPNVGKSTLFNALTKAGIAAENYPFCTIEPNVGVVEVPDPRLAALAEIVNPERILPAAVEFVDIAGLVAGASKGEGLGNQFLANIRETDAITHVVRCFEDANVIHVAGKLTQFLISKSLIPSWPYLIWRRLKKHYIARVRLQGQVMTKRRQL